MQVLLGLCHLSLKKPAEAEAILREAKEQATNTSIPPAELSKLYPALLAFSLEDQVGASSWLPGDRAEPHLGR